MPKVIKIIVSDKFFEEHIAGDPETLATQNVGFAEGMVRMIIDEHFKGTEEVELNTDDVTDVPLISIVERSIVNFLTTKIATEHGKKD